MGLGRRELAAWRWLATSALLMTPTTNAAALPGGWSSYDTSTALPSLGSAPARQGFLACEQTEERRNHQAASQQGAAPGLRSRQCRGLALLRQASKCLAVHPVAGLAGEHFDREVTGEELGRSIL